MLNFLSVTLGLIVFSLRELTSFNRNPQVTFCPLHYFGIYIYTVSWVLSYFSSFKSNWTVKPFVMLIWKPSLTAGSSPNRFQYCTCGTFSASKGSFKSFPYVWSVKIVAALSGWCVWSLSSPPSCERWAANSCFSLHRSPTGHDLLIYLKFK